MLSAEDYAAVKIAVEVCCSELKKQILIIPEKPINDLFNSQDYPNAKWRWDDKIEKTSTLILEKLGLKGSLQEKVTGFILQIGVRMLIWAKYHECFLGISRDFSVDIIKSSLFTSRGIIDHKKAAKELMKSERLNVQQRYKLACLYCLEDQIFELFRQMSTEDKFEFYIAQKPNLILQHNIVTFWSYDINGEIGTLIGERNVDKYLLEKAFECGSLAAVEFCLERLKLTGKVEDVIIVAVETLRNMGHGYVSFLARGQSGIPLNKDIRNLMYYKNDEIWIPFSFCIDILFFLFHEMTVDQLEAFVQEDFEGIFIFEAEYLDKSNKYTLILLYFLDWPFQNYFMTMVNCLWKFLLESDFADLLGKICDKIESDKGDFTNGEGKSFNYRNLLMEFWHKSPLRCKSYVLNNIEQLYCDSYDEYYSLEGELRQEKKFLGTLLMLKDFTIEDKKIISKILKSATEDEKKYLIFSIFGENTCIKLMKACKWGRLDLFMLNCLSSQEQISNFKLKLSFSKKAKRMCFDFAIMEKWNAVDSFIRWSALSEGEIKRLKKEIVLSFDCCMECKNLILKYKCLESAKKFSAWISSSQEEFREFKKKFIFSDPGFDTCCVLVLMGKLEQANKFVVWCLPSEEIISYKINLAHRYESVNYICAISFSDAVVSFQPGELLIPINLVINSTSKFQGGMCEQIDTFLNWCFSSKQKIDDFKRKKIGEEYGSTILVDFIRRHKLKKAEVFFSWIGLSSLEMRDLKKKTLISKMISTDVRNSLPFYSTDRWEIMKETLRWCLDDNVAVLEFIEKVKEVLTEDFCKSGGDLLWKKSLQMFFSFTEQLLSVDLDAPT